MIGTIIIDQKVGSVAKFNLLISGLDPDTAHGWHIYEKAVVGNNCSTAGGLFNPLNATYGAPTDTPSDRHYGDLGYFYANSKGLANITITD